MNHPFSLCSAHFFSLFPLGGDASLFAPKRSTAGTLFASIFLSLLNFSLLLFSPLPSSSSSSDSESSFTLSSHPPFTRLCLTSSSSFSSFPLEPAEASRPLDCSRGSTLSLAFGWAGLAGTGGVPHFLSSSSLLRFFIPISDDFAFLLQYLSRPFAFLSDALLSSDLLLSRVTFPPPFPFGLIARLCLSVASLLASFCLSHSLNLSACSAVSVTEPASAGALSCALSFFSFISSSSFLFLFFLSSSSLFCFSFSFSFSSLSFFSFSFSLLSLIFFCSSTFSLCFAISSWFFFDFSSSFLFLVSSAGSSSFFFPFASFPLALGRLSSSVSEYSVEDVSLSVELGQEEEESLDMLLSLLWTTLWSVCPSVMLLLEHAASAFVGLLSATIFFFSPSFSPPSLILFFSISSSSICLCRASCLLSTSSSSLFCASSRCLFSSSIFLSISFFLFISSFLFNSFSSSSEEVTVNTQFVSTFTVTS